MYINYLNDRKSLGYECLADILCGSQLVLKTELIDNSTVVFVKNVNLNGKHKIFVIIAIMINIFSNV